MAERVIWVIDREQWPRACLRAELIERGYDAVGFESIADALAALRQERPEVAVIDLAGQHLDAEALDAFRRRGCALVAVGGTVERQEPVARAFPWSRVLTRPVTLGPIADTVDGLLEGAGATAAPPG